jgi:DNA mismatch endonuclease (patch repair protein)
VHGCFWHGHKKCSRATRPNTNKDFWNKKLDANIIRDNKNIKLLKELGWEVLVIWQCQIKDKQSIHIRLKNFLNN